MSETTSTRRQFLGRIGRGVGVAAVGAAAFRLVARADGDKVWQLDPSVCDACLELNQQFENQSYCATECVLKLSAVKVVNDFDACGYCMICPGYHDIKSPVDDWGVPVGKVCPLDAIKRKPVGLILEHDPANNYYEYSIDENKCNGCGKCVILCKPPLGNGSFRLEVRHDLCVDCNQCAIASACPAPGPGPEYHGAFYRDEVVNPWPGRTPPPARPVCQASSGRSRPKAR